MVRRGFVCGVLCAGRTQCDGAAGAGFFLERGAPVELLADDAALRSREFAVFAARLGVKLRFRALHRPSGNSIVERNHRSVKVIAARQQCPVSEAVRLYNVTPRDCIPASSLPASAV